MNKELRKFERELLGTDVQCRWISAWYSKVWEVGQSKEREERGMGTSAGKRRRVKVGTRGSYFSGGTLRFTVPWIIGAYIKKLEVSPIVLK